MDVKVMEVCLTTVDLVMKKVDHKYAASVEVIPFLFTSFKHTMCNN